MRFTQCPRCAKLGKDTSKDNLCIFEDQHAYCFGCGYHRRAPDSLANMSQKMAGKALKTSTTTLDLDGCTQALPKEPLVWLRRYGITDEEIYRHGLCWNPESKQLVFPVLENERVVATCSRSFNGGAKYLTKGNTKHYKVFPKQASNVYVLVEDFVSAIKVGRHYNCIPLLGAHVSLGLILSLVSYKPRLRIFLDPDKRLEAMKYTARALQYLKDVGTIIADKDPKDYDDFNLKRIIDESLTANQQTSGDATRPSGLFK